MELSVEAATDGAACCVLTKDAIRRREWRIKLGPDNYAVGRTVATQRTSQRITQLKHKNSPLQKAVSFLEGSFVFLAESGVKDAVTGESLPEVRSLSTCSVLQAKRRVL